MVERFVCEFRPGCGTYWFDNDTADEYGNRALIGESKIAKLLNEYYEDSKKYHKMTSVIETLYQTTKLTDSTKKMFEMFSETFGFDLEVD